MLKQERPGLRGFSESNIKRMRQFYETWSPYFTNRPFETGDLSELDLKAVLSVGLTLHDILISKTVTLDERLFYIRMCAERFRDADNLNYYLNTSVLGVYTQK